MSQNTPKGRQPVRCGWAGEDPLYVAYHDREWGVPKKDDRMLFEKLILEGFQAGLSWITILRKRERFRQVFDDFDAEKIVRYDKTKLGALMTDSGIIRNRLKIEAAVSNAAAYLKLRESRSFAAYLWDFVDGTPIQNGFRKSGQIPAETEISRKMSKALKQNGFRFCGPTIIYAFMQSVGMVNDHLVDCHRHEPCRKKALAFRPPRN